jgi:hypothetical protein
MKVLLNPVVMRMGLLMPLAVAAFVLGAFAIRRLRSNLVADPELRSLPPLSKPALPVHADHAVIQQVIQQLEQQKHELTAQPLAERRRAQASDTLQATVLPSPTGMNAAELFRNATIRPETNGADGGPSFEQAVAPARAGLQATISGYAPQLAQSRDGAGAPVGGRYCQGGSRLGADAGSFFGGRKDCDRRFLKFQKVRATLESRLAEGRIS